MLGKLSLVGWALVLCLSPCRAADQADKDAAEAHYQRATKAWHQRDYKAAARLCERAIELDPGHAGAPNLLGSVYVQVRDFGAARKLYQKSHKLKPAFNSAFNLAEMDFCEKKWKEARTGFEGVLNRKDVDHTGLIRFKLAVIALKLGDQEGLEAQLAVFEGKKMQREIDFHELLVKIHNEKLAQDAAEALWLALVKKHEETHVFVDTLLEAYFIEAEA